MKKTFIVIIVLLTVNIFIVSCSNTGTNPESKRMRIYARLTNGSNDEGNPMFSEGKISVLYYPSVNQSSFMLDGVVIHEENEYGLIRDSWGYWDYQNYHWATNREYELMITANNNDFVSNASCEVPSEFTVSESSFSVEIDPFEDFSLSWSNCENETYFKLYYSIETPDSSKDSLIILDQNTTYFTFTSEILNVPNATDIHINLCAVNGPVIMEDSNGNFSEDGDGYFFGEYSRSLEFNYVNSRKLKPNNANRIKVLKERADNLFKQKLGF